MKTNIIKALLISICALLMLASCSAKNKTSSDRSYDQNTTSDEDNTEIIDFTLEAVNIFNNKENDYDKLMQYYDLELIYRNQYGPHTSYDDIVKIAKEESDNDINYFNIWYLSTGGLDYTVDNIEELDNKEIKRLQKESFVDTDAYSVYVIDQAYLVTVRDHWLHENVVGSPRELYIVKMNGEWKVDMEFSMITAEERSVSNG